MTYKSDRELFVALIIDYYDDLGCNAPRDPLVHENAIQTFVDEWMEKHHIGIVLGHPVMDEEVKKL